MTRLQPHQSPGDQPDQNASRRLELFTQRLRGHPALRRNEHDLQDAAATGLMWLVAQEHKPRTLAQRNTFARVLPERREIEVAWAAGDHVRNQRRRRGNLEKKLRRDPVARSEPLALDGELDVVELEGLEQHVRDLLAFQNEVKARLKVFRPRYFKWWNDRRWKMDSISAHPRRQERRALQALIETMREVATERAHGSLGGMYRRLTRALDAHERVARNGLVRVTRRSRNTTDLAALLGVFFAFAAAHRKEAA